MILCKFQKYRLNAINKTLSHIKGASDEKQDLQKDILRRKAQLHQVRHWYLEFLSFKIISLVKINLVCKTLFYVVVTILLII